VKNLTVITQDGRILFASATYPGTVHDKKIADACQIPPQTHILADLGFIGFAATHVNVLTPHKKPKNRELSEQLQKENSLSRAEEPS
jgi:hypothetical protein